jgi:2-polyprenyl-6-methoxyphenol hydroxylase-like FAD-dependent oxidoreductase
MALQIGGSIAGLMHGVVLKSLGHDVCIIEARQPDQLKAQAAGLSLGPSARELMETYLPDLDTDSYSMSTSAARFIAADGTVISENRTSIPVVCSTWSLVHEHLRTEFLRPVQYQGRVQYLTGMRVTSVADADDLVTVSSRNENSGTSEVASAHLVIVADGAYSTIRRQLVPEVEPKYAEIIAWRGYIPETHVPTELEAVFKGKLLMYRADGSYLIA